MCYACAKLLLLLLCAQSEYDEMRREFSEALLGAHFDTEKSLSAQLCAQFLKEKLNMR